MTAETGVAPAWRGKRFVLVFVFVDAHRSWRRVSVEVHPAVPCNVAIFSLLLA